MWSEKIDFSSTDENPAVQRFLVVLNRLTARQTNAQGLFHGLASTFIP